MGCSDRVISKPFNKRIQKIGGGKKVDTVGPECPRKCMVPVTQSATARGECCLAGLMVLGREIQSLPNLGLVER